MSSFLKNGLKPHSSPTRTLALMAASWAALAAAAPSVSAASAEPAGVVNLASTASTEVVQDLMSLTLSTTREGADAAAVQSALKQALDAALTEARKVQKPGQVDVQTGNFSLYPRRNSKGQISGWQGSAELRIEGRDMQAIGQLSGRISTLVIAGVSYAISPQQRDKVEAEVTADAIKRFRLRADDVAKQFGYTGYAVREVQVQSDDGGGQVMPMLRMGADAVALAESALPVAPGKGRVSVTVNGSVQLTR